MATPSPTSLTKVIVLGSGFLIWLVYQKEMVKGADIKQLIAQARLPLPASTDTCARKGRRR